MEGDPPHRFLAWILVLTVFFSLPVSADVGDNLSGWLINFLGYGKEDFTPDVYGGSIVERLNYLENKVTRIDATTTRIDRATSKLQSTAGGGCFYTVYSYKPYLDGYKIKLSDGTSSKSCTICYDDDSGYYSGILKAPLKDNITVSIIDAETDLCEGVFNTNCATTSGYATIDLDNLIFTQLTSIIKDDATELRTNLCKDSALTNNNASMQTTISYCYSGKLSPFNTFNSISGVTVDSRSFDDLLRSTKDMRSVFSSTVGETVLACGLAKRISNDKDILLRCISSGELCEVLNSSAAMGDALSKSDLQKVTEHLSPNTAQTVTGKFILLNCVAPGYAGYYDVGQVLNSYDGAIPDCYCVSHISIKCNGKNTVVVPDRHSWIGVRNSWTSWGVSCYNSDSIAKVNKLCTEIAQLAANNKFSGLDANNNYRAFTEFSLPSSQAYEGTLTYIDLEM